MIFIDMTGLEAVQAKLEKLVQRGENLTPLLAAIGAEEVSNILLRFEREQAPDGSAWEPLKTRKGQALSDTGRLKLSIRQQLLSDSILLIGSDVHYATYHQFGTSRIPARPFLGVTEDLLLSIEDFINEFFHQL